MDTLKCIKSKLEILVQLYLFLLSKLIIKLIGWTDIF